MKQGTKFNITYFASKHNKFITRAGQWDNKSKVWSTTKGETATTYFDTDANGYRTAIGETTITVKGK